jgi:hypothetical protein
MNRSLSGWLAVALCACVPGIAQAGWVGQWTNVAVRGDGERMTPEVSTMAIANGQMRVTQPQIVTVVDYNKGRFTVMNPTKGYFWTGTIDDYVDEMTRNRPEMREKVLPRNPGAGKDQDVEGEDAQASRPRQIDLNKLPPVSITPTGIKERIAGFETMKYEIRSDGELFQEVWVAPSLDVSGDLNLDKYLAEQRKLSTPMLGKSSGPYNALYRSEEYRKLLDKSFALKLVTHHIAGGFERVATSFQAQPQRPVPQDQEQGS